MFEYFAIRACRIYLTIISLFLNSFSNQVFFLLFSNLVVQQFAISRDFFCFVQCETVLIDSLCPNKPVCIIIFPYKFPYTFEGQLLDKSRLMLKTIHLLHSKKTYF